jgi:hypothetical protein
MDFFLGFIVAGVLFLLIIIWFWEVMMNRRN